jgi:L-lactate permease
MEGQTTQWPSERSVNGRTDNTMVIRKKGKWKDRQYNDHQKESKWKDRQHNDKQKEELLFFLMAIVLCVLPITLLLMAILLSVLPFTLLSDGHCVVCPSIYPSF